VLEVDCPVCLGQLTSGNGFVTFNLLECGHRCEAALTCAVCEAARTCAVRPPTRASKSPPKSTPLPSSAFPLRVSQGPRGMPAPNRGNARCRRRRGAHMPALPWCVTRHAHLCAEGRNGVTWRRIWNILEYGIWHIYGCAYIIGLCRYRSAIIAGPL
jgi:hypothetical protein